MPIPKLVGESRCVRRDEKVLQVPQRRIGGMRLFFKNIKSSSCDPLITQSVSQRGFIHLTTPTDVNWKHIALHQGNTLHGARSTTCLARTRAPPNLIRI